MLCLPVFYDNRWTAYIDGKKVTAYNINGGLTGISISPGVHEIRLIYHDPIVYVSICISGLALMGMALYLLLYRKRNLVFGRLKQQTPFPSLTAVYPLWQTLFAQS